MVLFPPVDLTSSCVSVDFTSKNPPLLRSFPPMESPEKIETKGCPCDRLHSDGQVSLSGNEHQTLTLKSLCVLSLCNLVKCKTYLVMSVVNPYIPLVSLPFCIIVT